MLLRTTFPNPTILGELEVVQRQLQRGRHFDCLRIIRKLFAKRMRLFRVLGRSRRRGIGES